MSSRATIFAKDMGERRRFEGLLDDVHRGGLHHAAELLAVETAPVDGADVALRPFDG